MQTRRRAIASVLGAMLITGLATTTASADPHRDDQPVVSVLTTVSALGSGSAVGPDRALYVPDGLAGAIWRIDPGTGATTQYAEGLPPAVFPDVGGPIDVAFHGRTAYALVTLVGGNIVDEAGQPVQPIGDAAVGIYRIGADGSNSLLADLGAWSAAHPPTKAGYFIDSGVPYSIETDGNGFVVADGHHNRILRVTPDGSISQLIDFGNVVPIGLEIDRGRVYSAQAGPIPHRPETSKVLEVRKGSQVSEREVAVGTAGTDVGLAVDVESGPHGDLYVLLQGFWDRPVTPENEGTPASPDTGRLVRVHDGRFEVVVDGLDRPTSVEFIGRTAYVVSLSGSVLKITGID
ncbi:MAG: hypothetical protein IT196_16405 [Acidimicrobiales bacterium]|nr:hypothetical protein [Acidimicrobiales bacterium]